MAQALAYRHAQQAMIVVDDVVERIKPQKLESAQDAQVRDQLRWELVRSIDVATICGDPKHWRGLATRAAMGDRPAYIQLLTDFGTFLQLFFDRLMPELYAKRMVDETLITVDRKFATCNPAKGILPWLLAIARYRAAHPICEENFAW